MRFACTSAVFPFSAAGHKDCHEDGQCFQKRHAAAACSARIELRLFSTLCHTHGQLCLFLSAGHNIGCGRSGVQQELDERVGCCLAYVEDLALRQHLVQDVSHLQRLVSSQHAFKWLRNSLACSLFTSVKPSGNASQCVTANERAGAKASFRSSCIILKLRIVLPGKDLLCMEGMFCSMH